MAAKIKTPKTAPRKSTVQADQAEAESMKDQLYAAMVEAVRAWIAAEHPRIAKDLVDIALFDSTGLGDTIASFHSYAASEYTFGDLRAMRGRD